VSVRRVERIIFYGEAMPRCYESLLSNVERARLHEWESSDAFTRTDDWPGWAKYIGLRPGAVVPRLSVMRRLA
jgi:hypothetical protein